MLKSEDGGGTWQLISTGPNGEFVQAHISRIIVAPMADPADPANPNPVLFASTYREETPGGTDYGGVYRSRDGGSTWVKLTLIPGSNAADQIMVSDLAFTYATAPSPGRFTLLAGVINTNRDTDFQQPQISGVWQSPDFGQTWARSAVVTSTNDHNVERISFASDPRDGGIDVYMAAANKKTSQAPAAAATSELMDVYQSTNSGATWSATGAPKDVVADYGWYTLALGLASNGRVYLGGKTGAIERDVTGQWHPLQGGEVHADMHAWAFWYASTADQVVIYNGNDGGIYRYAPDTSQYRVWKSLNAPPARVRGLQTLQLYSVAQHPSDINTLLEGSQDNGIGRTTDGGTTWDQHAHGDGIVIRYDPTDARGQIAYMAADRGDVARSTDGGVTWGPYYENIENHGAEAYGPFQTPFSIAPSNVEYVVVGAKGYLWLLNTPTGFAKKIGPFSNLGPPPTPANPSNASAVAMAPSNGLVIYAAFVVAPASDGSTRRVWRTSDAGGYGNGSNDPTCGDLTHWTDITPPANMLGRNYVNSITVDPDDPNVMYVAIESRGKPNRPSALILRYNHANWDPANPAAAWTNIAGNLPAGVPVQCVVIDKVDDRTKFLYAGTDLGVYRASVPAGQQWNWSRFEGLGGQLPFVQVVDLDIKTYDGLKYIVAGTHGRGAWRTEIPVVPAGRIGDLAWNDLDGDGRQDTGEPGMPDLRVQLFTSDDVFVTSTETNASGRYEFNGIAPDRYYLRFSKPGGFAFTDEDAAGDDAIDSDVNEIGRTDSFAFDGGEYLIVDAGLETVPVPNTYIGDFVWHDLNSNGFQNYGEPGIPGVWVQLYDSANVPIAGTWTDSAGHYQFTNVPAGTYYLVFTAPQGMVFSPKHFGEDWRWDSDANPSGATDLFLFGSASIDTTIDAGLRDYPYDGQIGDFIWHDANANGIQDPDEAGSGVGGVYSELLDSNGNVVYSGTTAGGNYLWGALPPGTYKVRFRLAPSDPPAHFTIKHAGNDPALDSDVNPGSGETDWITLGLDEVNRTIDAGVDWPTESDPPGMAGLSGFSPIQGESAATPDGGEIIGMILSPSLVEADSGAPPSTGTESTPPTGGGFELQSAMPLTPFLAAECASTSPNVLWPSASIGDGEHLVSEIVQDPDSLELTDWATL